MQRRHEYLGGRSEAGRADFQYWTYWCSVKHAHRVVGAHLCYPPFFDCGVADAYKWHLAEMRNGVSRNASR